MQKRILAAAVLGAMTLGAQDFDALKILVDTRRFCDQVEKDVKRRQEEQQSAAPATGFSSSSNGSGLFSNGPFKGDELLEQFFVFWNRGDRAAARNALSQAIDIADNDSMLGNNCSCRMKTLLQKAKDGELPDRFDEQDFSGSVPNNLRYYVYKPVWDQHSAKCDGISRRFQALGASFDAKTSVYRKEGEMQAFLAKQEVQKDYLKETGDTFDPNNRPSYSSGKREAWKKAKRIYDIFGD